jgi:hypothetical protein
MVCGSLLFVKHRHVSAPLLQLGYSHVRDSWLFLAQGLPKISRWASRYRN